MTSLLDQYLSEYPDAADEFGITVREHMDIQDSFSDDALKQVSKRARTTATNWHYTYGVPSTPRALARVPDSVTIALLSSLLAHNLMTLHQSATADEDEVAKRQAEVEPNDLSATTNHTMRGPAQ